MIKVLFLIHDLGQGGAEKVLVNLVNNMDPAKFDITLLALFGGGVNEQFLKLGIHYRTVFSKSFRGNSHVMKLFSPQTLHKWFVKERYDIEVSYLEGPCARIISGCPDATTKLVSWIHTELHNMKKLAHSFRSRKEATDCYDRFDQTVCVSQGVKEDFCRILDFGKPCCVLYNTVESEEIRTKSQEAAAEIIEDERIKLVAVGTLKESKGYERMLRIIKRLREEDYSICLYILGIGPQQQLLEKYIEDNNLHETVKLLGYKTNPYKYVAKCDLFICASFAEGFSTAATEALIVGTPVCTVEVSGMKEMLGNHNEYGLVAENNEEALYYAIKQLLDSPELLIKYKAQAVKRGMMFCTEMTVHAVEQMLLSI